ncbi:MAG TPA: hypothetical protein VM328_13150, partial [Fimbriimonadaceae bacterium]|nr:hypothetical protein [Fimbriimonadaceae bacterium]
DVLVAHGPVKYYSAKANIVCNRATIYRRERRAMLTGAVDMLLKPEDQQKLEVVEIPPFKPVVPEDIAKNRPPAPVGQDRSLDQEVRDTSTVRRYPVAVTANQIEYWYGRGQRRAIITGQPQARQELPGGRWRYAWAHRATYDGEKEILRMISSDGKKDTRVKTSVGDDIVATWFEMSTKEGEDQWSASGLEGDVYPDDDDIPPRTTNPPPASLSGPIGGNRRRP